MVRWWLEDKTHLAETARDEGLSPSAYLREYVRAVWGGFPEIRLFSERASQTIVASSRSPYKMVSGDFTKMDFQIQNAMEIIADIVPSKIPAKSNANGNANKSLIPIKQCLCLASRTPEQQTPTIVQPHSSRACVSKIPFTHIACNLSCEHHLSIGQLFFPAAGLIAL